MGIKEMLAAKKAAAEAQKAGVKNETAQTQASSSPVSNDKAAIGVENASGSNIKDDVQQEVQSSAPMDAGKPATVHVETETLPTAAEQNNPAAPNVPLQPEPEAVGPVYPTHDANGKPLSGFAMIQARKKADAEWALKNQGIVNVQPKEVGEAKAVTATGTVEHAPSTSSEQPRELQSPTPVSTNTTEQQSEPGKEASPEAEQAYSDLKTKLDALTSLSEDNLKTAMQDLKKSLMANPNAVALMLPSDIGQMVIALRKMTGVELAAAKEKSTTGKASKKKEAFLTAEEMEKAWEEL